MKDFSQKVLSVRETVKKLSLLTVAALFLLIANSLASGQVTLGTSPFTENFDNVGSGLPAGFTVRTGATATNLGTVATFNTAPTSFGTSTGQFANYASSDGLASTASVMVQAASTDRVIGLRQTMGFGDPGAAFVLQLANTTGKSALALSFKFQTLSVQGRNTTFTVDYGIGAAPTTFTALTTVGSGDTFGSQTVTANFGTALDNQSGPVFIRIVALTLSDAGTGGNRDTVAIDDLSLSFTSAAPTAAKVNVRGRVTDSRGRGIFRAMVSMTDGNGDIRYAQTNSFGYYLFPDVEVGQTLILSVRSKRVSFSQPTRIVSLTEDANAVDFEAFETGGF